jgi:hypothetical protein
MKAPCLCKCVSRGVAVAGHACRRGERAPGGAKVRAKLHRPALETRGLSETPGYEVTHAGHGESRRLLH